MWQSQLARRDLAFGCDCEVSVGLRKETQKLLTVQGSGNYDHLLVRYCSTPPPPKVLTLARMLARMWMPKMGAAPLLPWGV